MQVEIEPYSPVVEISATPTPRFTAIILSSVLLLTGIGSGWSVTQTEDVGSNTPVIVRPFVAEEGEAESEADPAIQRQDLTRIRDAFKLSMTELAQVLDVSRTALYAWFSGTVPHAKQGTRINALLAATKFVENSRIPRIDLLKQIPLNRGKTLLEVLRSNENVRGALVEVRELATARTASMENRRPRVARKEKIFGAEEISPSFSTFE
jgi:DNA-binding transcriptional regulator YiaG